MSLEAFVLQEFDRNRLREAYPPKFPEWIGHHVSHRFGTHDEQFYGRSAMLHIIGYAVTDGLEAFVVEAMGTTDRPDGKKYHLTWSLDRSKGFKPKDSNELVLGSVTPISPPIPINTVFDTIPT